MKTVIKTVMGAAALAAAGYAMADAILYENPGFDGRSVTAERRLSDLRQYGFNDRASSIVITGGRWEVCQDSYFNGRCVMLRPGRYPTLESMGLDDRISSLRSANIIGTRFDRDDGARDYSRRNGERLFQADVVEVRAVVGPPEQRCWTEREPVRERGNVGGAIAGALIGGVLGHQIGGGSGRDLATAGGAVAGAAIGANADRSGRGGYRDVQRCAEARRYDRADFYDVTYVFRGVEHRVQTTQPPGSTITVNRDGEPRIG